MVCEYYMPGAPRGVVAFLNVYGSAPRGPYYENHGSHNEFAGDTVERVEEGLKQFTVEFEGHPDAIIFRAEVWDMHKYTEDLEKGSLKEEERSALFLRFVRDVEGVFAGLRSRYPRAILGMHTIPSPLGKTRPLFFSYLAALRLIARRHRDIFLIDWHALVAPLDPSIVNKDAIHPDGRYSGPFYALLSGALQKWLHGCKRESPP